MAPKWIPVWVALILAYVVPFILASKYGGKRAFFFAIAGALIVFTLSAIDVTYTRVFVEPDVGYLVFVYPIIGSIIGAIVSWRLKK